MLYNHFVGKKEDFIIVFDKSKKDTVTEKQTPETLAPNQGPVTPKQEVDLLYEMLVAMLGTDGLVLRGAKVEALDLLTSEELDKRILGMERVIYQDPTINKAPKPKEYAKVLTELTSALADQWARQVTEENINALVQKRMNEKQDDYYREMKEQILKEQGGPENPHTLRQLLELEKMENQGLGDGFGAKQRPGSLQEIVGQQAAIAALLAKIANPYPQHVLLYGPPGVGKTSVARLVLEEAKKRKDTPFAEDAPFVETDGNTLRWDPRDATNPLIGSVHDPIYQGARRDFAESGVPEPKLGLVSQAHGGILFIDEIGEMDPMLLNKLLKVLEDKRVTFDSSYFDPSEPNVPQYIKKLFEEGAPADFILIGATTRSPEEINPAIRSRCSEVFFQPLTPDQVAQAVLLAAKRLAIDCPEEVARQIANYTREGRKAVGLLTDAYGMALSRGGAATTITLEDLAAVAQAARLTPHPPAMASDTPQQGRVFGLGVYGYMGSVIELEAVALAARQGKGKLRFNDTAGSMAKDAVFNSAFVIKKLTGKELDDFDLQVNAVGGGNIDGPSAGLACTIALYSAITGALLRQDTAITGEIALSGKVKPVGGIAEKIYGARQAGMKRVLLPKENQEDIPLDHGGIQVIPVETLEEALELMVVKA